MSARQIAAALLSAALVLIGLGVGATPAKAIVVPCVFVTTGSTMLLTNHCTTETAILVPNGMTLDGNGYSITAVEPAVGHFTGAVVQNATAPSVIHVTNLTVKAQLPANPCDAGEDRLRGIMFMGASGTITNNVLFDINQGVNFGCQEGNAIEARNFDGESLSSSIRTDVTISDNFVQRYQKTGVLVNGLVDAIVARNTIEGAGPSTAIAQNGVQVGFGATALVSANTISGNNYPPNSFFACGIIVVDADGVDRKQQDNLFPSENDPAANEKDTCGFAKGGNYDPFGN